MVGVKGEVKMEAEAYIRFMKLLEEISKVTQSGVFAEFKEYWSMYVKANSCYLLIVSSTIVTALHILQELEAVELSEELLEEIEDILEIAYKDIFVESVDGVFNS